VAGRLLRSPRFRRRLLKAGLVVVAFGAAATVSIVFWNTGRELPDTPLSTEPETVAPTPRNIRLTKAEHDAAIHAAARFVATAVRREHTGDSWELVTPALRQGMTRAQWAKGNIPVQYYPVDAARWKMDYSYDEELGLEVYVLPDKGEQLRPMVFTITMKPLVSHGQRRWLVDSFAPTAQGIGQSPPAAAATPAPRPQATTQPRAPLGAVWLAVPGLLVLSVVLVPTVIALRERRRTRRAERDYRDSLG
jgi:hypothetical protein